jgi:CSLREA domain-containing protein
MSVSARYRSAWEGNRRSRLQRTQSQLPLRSLRCEALERRDLLTVYTVNSDDDANDGHPDVVHCSLREAILAANAQAGLDRIEFAVPGSGPHTIRPLSALPAVTDAVILDGTTQPGFAGTPIVELDGSAAGSSRGLDISAGGSTIRGLVINRFALDGIYLSGAGGNTISGNYVGTDIAGAAALGNGLSGVACDNTPGNTIGGTEPGAGNVISANASCGVYLGGSLASGNVVLGNFVGTDASGSSAIGNGWNGVWVLNAPRNTIGGTVIGSGNLVSGNTTDGIAIQGGTADGNVVQGNRIGTNAVGDAGLPNHHNGVFVLDGASRNTIGGDEPAASNVVAYNSQWGVVMYVIEEEGRTSVRGNEIRRNTESGLRVDMADGTLVQGNTITENGSNGVEVINNSQRVTITRNLIYGNGAEDIDLNADGWTPNDPADVDTGSNGLLNFPELRRTAGTASGYVRVAGEGVAGATVEFFRSADAYSHADATAYLGSATVGPGGDFSIDLPATQEGVTATATDPSGATSEFSASIPAIPVTEDAVYLLITNQALSTAFQPLVDRRTSQGRPGQLLTVEWIDAHYDGTRPDGGTDLPTKIRNCIKDYYEHHGTRWVALGGDDQIVPVRMCVYGSRPDIWENTIDLYYNALDDTWDKNADGAYGEAGVDDADFYPQVALGRIPVRSAEDATAYFDKVIRYETSPTDGFADTMLMVGSDGATLSGLSRPVGYQDHEPITSWEVAVRDVYCQGISPDWQASYLGQFFGRYTSWDEERCGDYLQTPEHLAEQLNQGYHDVFLWGHGNPGGWVADYGWLDVGVAANLNNIDRPSIFYAESCGTAEFMAEPSLSEALLRNPHGGAVAYIGHVDTEWFTTWRGICFYRELHTGGRATLGEVFAHSKLNFERYHRLEQCLLGDPALVLLGEETGRHLQVLSPKGCEVIDTNSRITVRWNAAGAGFAVDEEVRLDYSADGGNSWQPIPGAESIPCKSRTFDWDATALPAGSHYRVRVTSLADHAVNDASDRDFRIADQGILTVQSTPIQNTADVPLYVTGTCPQYTNYTYSVVVGDPVSLTAPGLAGYNFLGWRDGSGNTLTRRQTVAFTFTGDSTVVAAYEVIGEARDYYVNDDADPSFAAGSDDSDGLSPDTPMRHIQAVIDRYGDIATLHVAPGTYSENLTLGSADPRITIEGAGRDSTVIDAGEAGSCLVVGESASTTLRGLTLRNGRADFGAGIACTKATLTLVDSRIAENTAAYDGGGLLAEASTVVVAGCEVSGNTAQRWVAGLYFLLGCVVTIDDNTVSGNTCVGYGAGLHFGNGTRGTISRNVIRANVAQIDPGGGVDIFDGSDIVVADCLVEANLATTGAGVYVRSGAKVTMVNDTVVANQSTAVGGGIYVENGSSATVKNSVVRDNLAPRSPQIASYSAEACQASYSNIAGGWPGDGNVDADPLFVRNPDDGGDGWGTGGNDDYGDLRLRRGSPCIDRGVAAIAASADLLGRARHDDPGMPNSSEADFVDLGAYEFPGDSGDTTPPSVVLSRAADQADPADDCPLRFTVIFSEPVCGLDAAHVLIQGTAGGVSTVSVSSQGEDSATYEITVTGLTATGTVSVSIQAAATEDLSGNPNELSTGSENTVLLDLGLPASQVDPLPAQATGAFLVQWAGEDDPGGSGIACYDVYVSCNGGPFSVWLRHTEAVSAMFSAPWSGQYAFYSVACDRVGHEEQAPAAPDVQISVLLRDTLDVDMSETAAGLTDGLLILRYLFDFRGAALVRGVLAGNANRTDADVITAYLDAVRSSLLDVDQNDVANGFTDGLLILRYLFDFRGDALVRNAVGEGARRASPDEILAFLDSRLPPGAKKSPAVPAKSAAVREESSDGRFNGEHERERRRDVGAAEFSPAREDAVFAATTGWVLRPDTSVFRPVDRSRPASHLQERCRAIVPRFAFSEVD